MMEDGLCFQSGLPLEDFLDDIEHCLTNEALLNEWEARFCFSLLGFARLSAPQQHKLSLTVRKVNMGLASHSISQASENRTSGVVCPRCKGRGHL